MNKPSCILKLSGLLTVMILMVLACTPDQTGKHAVRRVYGNGVETYEYNGETLAMEFPRATTEQARQFVTNLFGKRFDYTKIYEQDTDLKKVLTASFGAVLHQDLIPVNNEFENKQIDMRTIYQFKGLNITYYITSQGKKIFEKLNINGEPAIPLIYNLKIGMKTGELIAKLGEPVSRQQDNLYYGQMDEAGLYYEVQVTTINNQIAHIELRIAGGV